MKLQNTREQYNKGDQVYLIVKRKPARVLEVLRAACRLEIEGETRPRVVRFQLIEPAPAPLPRPPSKPAPLRAVVDAAPARRQQTDDIDEWLQLGHGLLQPIEEVLRGLQEEDAALEDEAKALAAHREALRLEIKRQQKRAAKIRAALDEEQE